MCLYTLFGMAIYTLMPDLSRQNKPKNTPTENKLISICYLLYHKSIKIMNYFCIIWHHFLKVFYDKRA